MSEETNNFFQTNRDLIVFTVLALLILLIYWQATGFGFINLDDNIYVYNNNFVQKGLTGETIKWAFTTLHAANWHPLTWLSHEFDVQLFGLNPGAHHASSIIFHIINSILAFVVFRQITGCFWKSAVVAAIFAVHPTHVESVAWVAERKDLLSTLFWLLTMSAYFRYTQEKAQSSKFEVQNDSEIKTKKSSKKSQKTENEDSSIKPANQALHFYLLTIILFALGLMAKPMLVTLPLVLVLCDFWPFERLKTFGNLKALLIEKIPLFALSAVSCVVTVFAQRAGGAIETLDYLPLQTRIFNAFVSYLKYIGMFFYPSDLAVWYPYYQDIPVWQIAAGVILLTGVTALCLWQIRTRKYLLMGWLWFLGTLVPVIGLVQVGGQSLADRYTYIPYFGLLIMIVWGISDLFGAYRKPLLAIAGAVVLVFMIMSHRQTSLWINSETLFQHSLIVTGRSFLVEQNLCFALMTQDRLDEAEPLCRASIAEKPNSFEVYNTLGIIQIKRRQYAEAEQSFKDVLKLTPNYVLAHINLSISQSLQGKPAEAEKTLEQAYHLSGPQSEPAAFQSGLDILAAAFAKDENYAKTAESLNRLLHFVPENVEARLKLALALSKLNRLDEAQAQVEEVLREEPNRADGYNLYGLILLEKNQKDEAARQFEKALQLRPDSTEAKENLKKAKGEK